MVGLWTRMSRQAGTTLSESLHVSMVVLVFGSFYFIHLLHHGLYLTSTYLSMPVAYILHANVNIILHVHLNLFS